MIYLTSNKTSQYFHSALFPTFPSILHFFEIKNSSNSGPDKNTLTLFRINGADYLLAAFQIQANKYIRAFEKKIIYEGAVLTSHFIF